MSGGLISLTAESAKVTSWAAARGDSHTGSHAVHCKVYTAHYILHTKQCTLQAVYSGIVMIGETHCEHISLTLFISHIVLRLAANTGVLCSEVQFSVQWSVLCSVQWSAVKCVYTSTQCTWTQYGCSEYIYTANVT